MKPVGFLSIIAAFLIAAGLSGSKPLMTHAQDEGVVQLRQKNAELEKSVKELKILLEQCIEAKQNQFSEDRGWQNKKNWRSLETGMNKDQVKALLGEPVKEIRGVKTLWYYPSIYSGYVSFDDQGRLSGWKEP